MTHQDSRDDDPTMMSRRTTLECMVWAGTGVLWSLAGGVPVTLSLLDQAKAAEPAANAFTFLQISDSHVGFDRPANPHALETLKVAIDHIAGLKTKPAFAIHTGDITHLSKPAEFDNAAQIIGGAKLDVHYVPGEHDQAGVHFIGLVNVANLKAGGLGSLGQDQLDWLKDDLKPLTASTPIVVFAHIPLWAVYPTWGWGTEDAEMALGLLKRFGSVTVLNGHIHQLMQKIEGNVQFHTARSTAFPQPAPGTAQSPGPMLVPAEKLRSMLGVSSVLYVPGKAALAITDTALSDL
jgi:hypothetical protein